HDRRDPLVGHRTAVAVGHGHHHVGDADRRARAARDHAASALPAVEGGPVAGLGPDQVRARRHVKTGLAEVVRRGPRHLVAAGVDGRQMDVRARAAIPVVHRHLHWLLNLDGRALAARNRTGITVEEGPAVVGLELERTGIGRQRHLPLVVGVVHVVGVAARVVRLDVYAGRRIAPAVEDSDLDGLLDGDRRAGAGRRYDASTAEEEESGGRAWHRELVGPGV